MAFSAVIEGDETGDPRPHQREAGAIRQRQNVGRRVHARQQRNGLHRARQESSHRGQRLHPRKVAQSAITTVVPNQLQHT